MNTTNDTQLTWQRLRESSDFAAKALHEFAVAYMKHDPRRLLLVHMLEFKERQRLRGEPGGQT
jgi:hypothetical protein